MAAQQPLSRAEGPTDTRAVELILAARFWVLDDDGDNGDAIAEAAQKILTGDWLARRDARVRAAALRDAYKHLEHLLNEYPVPVACAAGIDGEFHNWAFDQIGETEGRDVREGASAPAERSVGSPTPEVGTQPTPLDGACFSVYLHGKWRYLTKQMRTEEKDAFADAVDRYGFALEPDEPRSPVDRWWRDPVDLSGQATDIAEGKTDA